MTAEMRMDAYYYGFTFTGEETVDRVLSAVACAGKAYHHTDNWGEKTPKYEDFFRGDSPIDWIQSMADDAAAQIKQLRAELDQAVATIEDRNAELDGRLTGWTSFTKAQPAAGQKIEIEMIDNLLGLWSGGQLVNKIESMLANGIDVKWRPAKTDN